VHADLVAPLRNRGDLVRTLLAVAPFDEDRGRQAPALEQLEELGRAVVEVVDGEAGDSH